MGELELAGRGTDLIQIGWQAASPVEHLGQGPAERADLDLVEVHRGQLVAEAGRPRLEVLPVGAGRVKRQRQLLASRPILRNDIDQSRPGAGLRREGREPDGPIVAIPFEVALVEQDDDRLVGLDRFAEELLDCGVVVFLLGEDGQDDVGHLADRPGPAPVDGHVGVDVGGIQKHQSRGDVLADPPEEQILRRFLERVLGRLPRAKLETLEEPLEDRRIVGSRRGPGPRGASSRRPGD